MARPKPKKTLAQKLADPRLRASLPDSALSPKLLAARRAAQSAKRQNADPLYNPNAPLSGRSLRGAVNSLVDLETRPQMDALERQGKNFQTQGAALSSRTDGIYRDIAQREAAGIDTMRALRDRTQGTLKGIAEGTVAATQTAGGTVEGDRISAERAALAARAGRVGENFQSAAALQGANYEGLAGAMSGVTQMRRGEVQERLATRLANQLGENEEKQADVRSQRGGLRTKYLLDLRDKEFTNSLARKEFNLKEADVANDALGAVAKAQADAAADATKADSDFLLKTGYTREAFARLTPQQRQKVLQDMRTRPGSGKDGKLSPSEQKTLQQVKFFNENGYYPPTGKPKANSGSEPKPPPASSTKYVQNISQGRSRWKTLMADPRARKNGGERWVKRVMLREGVPPEAYNAIYDLERRGSIDPRNVEALEALGVTVPKKWRRKR